MKALLRHLLFVFWGSSLLAACALHPKSPSGDAACTGKDKSKYDPSSLTQIEARLSGEASRASWEAVPEAYRAWAAERLSVKVHRAAATLAESHNCREVEAAASKVIPLGKRIAEVAKKCTDDQCVSKHREPPAIESELDVALCPLYPFC